LFVCAGGSRAVDLGREEYSGGIGKLGLGKADEDVKAGGGAEEIEDEDDPSGPKAPPSRFLEGG